MLSDQILCSHLPRSHLRQFAPGVAQKTLYRYDLAASPHLAALASGKVSSSFAKGQLPAA